MKHILLNLTKECETIGNTQSEFVEFSNIEGKNISTEDYAPVSAEKLEKIQEFMKQQQCLLNKLTQTLSESMDDLKVMSKKLTNDNSQTNTSFV